MDDYEFRFHIIEPIVLWCFFFFRKEYVERLTLSNHKNFVSSVCVLGDGEWICTGSNDATICVYAIGSVEPFTTLRGHTATGKSIIQRKTSVSKCSIDDFLLIFCSQRTCIWYGKWHTFKWKLG